MPPLESPFYEAMLPDERALAFRRSLAAAAKGGLPVVDPLEGLGNIVSMFDDGGYPSDDEHRLLGYARPQSKQITLTVDVFGLAMSTSRLVPRGRVV